jgi:hypothetical protein
MAFLTPAQLAKAQAEAEGFQNGPQPALNPANIYTQDSAGNPTTPSTSAAPYYPSKETPKLQLSTRDMSAELANNMVILDNALVSTGPAPTLQIQKNSYAITQADITAGFCIVPVAWPEDFADNDYNIAWSVSDTSAIPPAPRFAVGEIYSQTPAGYTAIVEFPVAVAIVQAQDDQVNSILPTPLLSLTAALDTMYQVTMYYGPARTDAADNGKSWGPQITWTDPAGNNLTANGSSPTIILGPAQGGALPNGVNYMQAFNIPFFVKGGTSITVTGSYTGGTFPMNVSIRVVQMPNNALLPVAGTVITVESIAVHP